MKACRKQRLYFILMLIVGVGVATGLVLYALQKNINLFYTPSQIVEGQAPQGHSFRVGGLVEKGSIKRSERGLQVSFILTDSAHEVTVQYKGILPDLFREGQGIVAQGKLNAEHVFMADQVLAKHDEKYMPPEVEHAITQAEKKAMAGEANSQTTRTN